MSRTKGFTAQRGAIRALTLYVKPGPMGTAWMLIEDASFPYPIEGQTICITLLPHGKGSSRKGAGSEADSSGLMPVNNAPKTNAFAAELKDKDHEKTGAVCEHNIRALRTIRAAFERISITPGAMHSV